MRVLITGITGRIGANLAAALRKEGHVVRGLVWPRDPRTEKLEGLGVELQYGSITEPSDVSRAVDGVDSIYHFGAAFQGGGPFTSEQYFEINVRGTFNMLEAAPTPSTTSTPLRASRNRFERTRWLGSRRAGIHSRSRWVRSFATATSAAMKYR